MNWTTIFMGPVAQAEMLRCELEAKGIPVFIPEENIRTIDPFMVGGLLVFDRAVQVPPSAVARAREVVDGLDGAQEPKEAETELPADYFEAEAEAAPTPDETRARAATAAQSRRILWTALFTMVWWFVPWQFEDVIWLAVPSALYALAVLVQSRGYLTAVKNPALRPPLHAVTVVAVVLAGLSVVATTLFALQLLG